ncbi:hypothetical protein K469DRAFT_665086 [Zopfia rhizophila CBS 207.26]|uniref:Integral membrane protein-like protein n=1 Tax=Zopfia rhizophila CBS 207.26 TaxID=1314779 RepID=A0A6A6E116_9PEZI|nr:hypothetical protein K469DRAFT_665086 [Zopfia rhizophila CBS 207.26]
MRKFRFSAIIPFACAVVSFALTLVLLSAGSKPGQLDDQYMVSLNTSKVGQNIIRFEPATSTSASPTSTSTSPSNPLDPLNPFSTSNPLNPNNPNNPLSGLNDILDPVVGNLTDAIDGGLQDSVNTIISALVDTVGVRDFYHLFLMKVCEGDATNSTNPENEVRIDRCSSYEDEEAGLKKITSNIQSSVVVGTTNISVPLIGELTNSLNTLSSTVSSVRKVVIAFLIISLVGSGLSFISTLPAIFFQQSRMLVYFSLFWPSLAATFQFLAACVLTAMIVTIAQLVGGFGAAVSIHIREGAKALLFVWLSWLFILIANVYWFCIWFVEVRTWAFVRRERTEEERGNWRGIGKEVIRDLKGRKGE